ncbi:MAG: signal peptide peptidase SppA [Dehalococcoidia bacterium]|nr:signal peptide peptidase SppA [Dehalococcoidia bacterium]
MRKKKMILVALAVLLLAVMLVPAGCVAVMPSGGKVAVISLSGTITNGGSYSFLGSTITPGSVREQLYKAEKDAAVKAIVLRVDSPGGQVVPSEEISAMVEEAKESKPVVVSMGSMAASGGYYISAKADKIVAFPGTATGSIGVISQIPNLKGLYEKLGIEMQTFTGGKYKDMYSGLRELTPEEKEIMQQMVDVYYEQFVDVVAEGRELDKEEVRDLATGQLYTGAEAKELGLVDELGGLDTAINLASELAGVTSPEVEYYKPPDKSLLESLLGISLDSLAYAIQMRLLGLDGQDMVLLQVLNYAYPEPQYLISFTPLP